MAHEPVFDPRHDAVFQRGYEAGSTPGTRPTAAADAPAPAREAPAAASASVPGHRAGSAPSGGPSARTEADTLRQNLADLNVAEEQAPPLAELADTHLQEAALVPPRKPSRFNPFILALWVLGPALFLGGSWLQVQAATRSYNSNFSGTAEMPFDMVIQQFLWSLTPAMVAAGITTMLGLLFWHAWHWRAARR
ncbi:hypothetical protein GY21_16685 [Cryobacterium roopkundense]|nr:hypothetical protein GY21_16685 [Cryobacterium roopkundense]